jgi:hypothetical protein
VRALRVDGATPRGPVLLVMGHAGLGLFISVARLRQAERTLCVWAALGFQPSGQFKLENPFCIFWFQFKLKF